MPENQQENRQEAEVQEVIIQTCVRCGDNDTHIEYTSDNNGDVYCLSCYDDMYTTCDACGEELDRDSAVGCEGDSLCETCRESLTLYCRDCGNRFYAAHYQDSEIHSCMANNDEDDETFIQEYHFHKAHVSPIFYGGDDGMATFYGCELEIECKDDGDRNPTARDILEENSDYVYCESDGSLSHGIEIISQPMTLDWLHSNNLWERISKIALAHDCKSHETGTCGLHVHISRTGFESDAHLKKFLVFWYSQDRIITVMARRDYSHYCSKKNLPARKIPPDSFLKSYDRYEQVNLTNRHTVEIRRFKGTLKASTIMACIELCDASRVYVAKKTYDEINNHALTELDFLSWVIRKSKTYPNLAKKLQEKITFNTTSE